LSTRDRPGGDLLPAMFGAVFAFVHWRAAFITLAAAFIPFSF
jgi:hypothetical protein